MMFCKSTVYLMSVLQPTLVNYYIWYQLSTQNWVPSITKKCRGANLFILSNRILRVKKTWRKVCFMKVIKFWVESWYHMYKLTQGGLRYEILIKIVFLPNFTKEDRHTHKQAHRNYSCFSIDYAVRFYLVYMIIKLTS